MFSRRALLFFRFQERLSHLPFNSCLILDILSALFSVLHLSLPFPALFPLVFLENRASVRCFFAEPHSSTARPFISLSRCSAVYNADSERTFEPPSPSSSGPSFFFVKGVPAASCSLHVLGFPMCPSPSPPNSFLSLSPPLAFPILCDRENRPLREVYTYTSATPLCSSISLSY